MSSDCVLLMNSRAGALRTTASEDQMRQWIAEIDGECEVIGTASEQEMHSHLERLVHSGVPRVAVAGGDGTVARAVQVIAGTGTALGIVPQGTANNFATALRLPMDLPSALRVIMHGDVRDVDLGRIGDRYFTEAAGVGLFADVLAHYGQSNKNPVRALYAILRVLASFRASRLRIQVDDEKVVERAAWCTVANTYRMAYAVPVAPGASVVDGLLDVVIVGDLNMREMLEYYRAVRAQLHGSLPKVTTLQGRTISISSRRRLHVHCDDSVIGHLPVTINSVPAALRVVVDRM